MIGDIPVMRWGGTWEWFYLWKVYWMYASEDEMNSALSGWQLKGV